MLEDEKAVLDELEHGDQHAAEDPVDQDRSLHLWSGLASLWIRLPVSAAFGCVDKRLIPQPPAAKHRTDTRVGVDVRCNSAGASVGRDQRIGSALGYHFER